MIKHNFTFHTGKRTLTLTIVTSGHLVNSNYRPTMVSKEYHKRTHVETQVQVLDYTFNNQQDIVNNIGWKDLQIICTKLNESKQWGAKGFTKELLELHSKEEYIPSLVANRRSYLTKEDKYYQDCVAMTGEEKKNVEKAMWEIQLRLADEVSL